MATTGNTTPATARNTCKHPGPGDRAGPGHGVLRRPRHTKVTAWRERRRLAAEAGNNTDQRGRHRQPRDNGQGDRRGTAACAARRG